MSAYRSLLGLPRPQGAHHLARPATAQADCMQGEGGAHAPPSPFRLEQLLRVRRLFEPSLFDFPQPLFPWPFDYLRSFRFLLPVRGTRSSPLNSLRCHSAPRFSPPPRALGLRSPSVSPAQLSVRRLSPFPAGLYISAPTHLNATPVHLYEVFDIIGVAERVRLAFSTKKGGVFRPFRRHFQGISRLISTGV